MSKPIFALLLLLSAVGCASSATQLAGPNAAGGFQSARRQRAASTPIRHVIVVMQENRSFDNMFNGFPGANTVSVGQGENGKTFTLQKIPLTWKFDVRHDHPQFLEDYDSGKGDGFQNQIKAYKRCRDPINHPGCWIIYQNHTLQQMTYSYVDPSQLQPYWTMAQQYALGDDTFSSNNGPSFVSHQFMIAAQSGNASEVPDGQPWGCDANKAVTVELLEYGAANPPVFSAATGHEIPGPFPCFNYPTIANLLDAAGVTWRYYVNPPPKGGSLLSAFDAIQPVRYGPDWKNVVHPNTTILKDIADGGLQQVSWVMPVVSNSDHPGPGSGDKGPDWVASIVNAVGGSQYWQNTAVIVMWDEWGGWYDHVVPPQLPDPVTGTYEGLGFRVPVIIASPYAKPGYISHQQHEVASTLRFIEETFDLPSLGLADARTDGFDDMFNFSQKPLKFHTIPTAHDSNFFRHYQDNAPGDTY